MADKFDSAYVEAALTSTRFAGQLQHFPSIGSTNVFALQEAQAGAIKGVYVADEQTAGRGRSGHSWHSAAGDGLYVSVLLRPQMRLVDALWLALSTGLAARAAITVTTGLEADIRWPNDLLIGKRKCGGVLVETSAVASQSESAASLRYAVIGVGINVNHDYFPPELENLATSLRLESGELWPREELLVAFLRALEVEIDQLEAELRGAPTGAGLLRRFGGGSSWVRGKRVRVEEGGGYTGVTDGLDARGFLRVAGDDGVVRTVLSGGVREG